MKCVPPCRPSRAKGFRHWLTTESAVQNNTPLDSTRGFFSIKKKGGGGFGQVDSITSWKPTKEWIQSPFLVITMHQWSRRGHRNIHIVCAADIPLDVDDWTVTVWPTLELATCVISYTFFCYWFPWWNKCAGTASHSKRLSNHLRLWAVATERNLY